MNRKKTRIALSTVLLGFAVVSLMAGGFATAQEAATPEDWILARAMELTGQAAGELQVASVVTANYRSLGEEVIAGKVVNAASREVQVVYVDAEGNAIDRDMEAEELAAKIASGPIEASLRERLAAASPEEMIPVAFWVPGTRPEIAKPGFEVSREELAAWEVDGRAERVAALTAGKESFLAEMAAAGFEPDSVPETSAAIFATLPASAVASLATHPDVVHVFLDEGKMQDLGTGYGDPVRTSRGMRTHKFNDMSGAGENPGVLECCGEVYWSDAYPYGFAGHPYIRGINMHHEGVCPDEDHPTAVVGFLASGHTDHRGQAYNAHVNFTNDCEGDGGDLVASMDWLDSGAGNYADPINHSYGLNTGGNLGDVVAARLDESVYFGYDTNVVAAGNNYQWVETPAIAYNVIAVGNIDDKQTWGWADDTMRASSSFWDPNSTHGDREKPEVSAAGTDLESATTTYPWIGNVGSGTSYSAPIVSAAATVAMEGNSLLAGYPETVKAVLMATAWNNVEGNWWLSDKDGAGGIDAYRAFLVAYNSTNGHVAAGYHNCGDGTEQIGSFAVAAGRKVRVVLVWSTDPDYANYVSQPGSDIDLEVRDPNGSSYGSYSWDNTYEVVHFDSTPASGGYQVWLYEPRCSEPTGYIYYAWAWAREQ
jgi:hypothetical protein